MTVLIALLLAQAVQERAVARVRGEDPVSA